MLFLIFEKKSFESRSTAAIDCENMVRNADPLPVTSMPFFFFFSWTFPYIFYISTVFALAMPLSVQWAANEFK